MANNSEFEEYSLKVRFAQQERRQRLKRWLTGALLLFVLFGMGALIKLLFPNVWLWIHFHLPT